MANLTGADMVTRMENHDAELRAILLGHRDWMLSNGGKGKRAGFAKRDLTGVDLGKLNLSAADFRGATLNGANLAEAVLAMANLSFTDLRNARMEGADIRGASFERANMNQANLTNAVAGPMELRSGQSWPTSFLQGRIKKELIKH